LRTALAALPEGQPLERRWRLLRDQVAELNGELALARLRWADPQGCVARHTSDSCLPSIAGTACTSTKRARATHCTASAAGRDGGVALRRDDCGWAHGLPLVVSFVIVPAGLRLGEGRVPWRSLS
jgi:hypothetical protein